MLTVKVGQTWLTEVGNVFRVQKIVDTERVQVKRIAIIANRDAKPIIPNENDSVFVWDMTSLTNTTARLIAGNPNKFDEWLAAESA